MAITASDLLNQAKSLSITDELGCRAAINRGYYAAFHAANSFHCTLQSPGALPSSPVGMHDQLYHQLLNPTIGPSEISNNSKKIGIIAKDLKRSRVKADYMLNEQVTAADVAYVVTQADKLLQMVSK